MKKLFLLLILSLGFTAAANAHHSHIHAEYDPSAAYYAEIICDAAGIGEHSWLQHCMKGDFLELTKNSITKSYDTNDFAMWGGDVVGGYEDLRSCSTQSSLRDGCFFDLPEHFTVRVWLGTDFAKLVLKIWNKSGDIVYQDETSRKWSSLAVSN
jgi:hypothetical protein